MTYEKTIQYLYDSQPVFHIVGTAAYKPGFDNMLRLMAAMDDPHKAFRCVHVAGTNGKGSTSHMLAAVLQSAGYRVGLYTSPHLVDYRERIRINGEMIPKREVIRFVTRYKSLLEEVRPSFFETTTALAFSWFAKQQVDIAVIEVGLGGRLDSTNIITPEVSVITNIGMDHTEFLGNTLPEIAAEKAGIIKQGVPVVIGERDSQTEAVFIRKAGETCSEIIFADSTDNIYKGECQLRGLYQQKNIRTVLAAIGMLQKQGWEIADKAISEGLAHVCDLTGLHGRWEVIRGLWSHGRSPVSSFRSSVTIILDTGHNSHGVRTYVDDLKTIEGLRIVFGMVSDKDVKEVLDLLPKDAKYYFCQATTKRAVSAEELLQMGIAAGLTGSAFPSVDKAVHAAIKEAAAGDTVFIGGSNYVVGEALVVLNQQKISQNRLEISVCNKIQEKT